MSCPRPTPIEAPAVAPLRLITGGPHEDSAIPSDLRALLTRLAKGRTAAVRLDRVSDALLLEPDEAAEALAAMQALDLVEIWEQGPGNRPCVILTIRGAALLGLELADRNHGGFELYWVPIGSGVDAGPRPQEGECAVAESDMVDPGELASFLDHLPDPRAVDPAKAAERGGQMEDIAIRKTVAKSIREGWRPPNPVLILGISLSWPVPRQPGQPCPVCQGRPLPFLAFCAVDGCERSGLDGMLPAVPACVRPKPYRPKNEPRGPATKGGKRNPALGGGTGVAGVAKEVKVSKAKARRYGRPAGRA